MDINLSKYQLPKLVQSGRFLGKGLGNLDKRILLDLAVNFTKDVFPKLATKAASSAIDKFERIINGKGVVRAGKGFNLYILNEYMDDNIKIVDFTRKIRCIN